MTRRLFALLRQQPIALLALFVAMGGTSFAAVNAKDSESNVIIGCVGDRSGQLRVVDSAVRCGSRETAISFNREGEQGKAGKTGARGKAGDEGADGRAGASGAAGADGATGPAGADGLDGATGRAGADGADGATGPAGPAASDSPSDLLTALRTVDGPTSGLDADTLDGVQASALLTNSGFGALFGIGSQATTISGAPGGDSVCVIGAIALTAANFPPPNTMFAAGQTLPIAQYSALYSLLGTTYGGNGTTNFQVPDLRAQAPGKTNYTMCMNGDYPSRG
jgi:hypothetical protein